MTTSRRTVLLGAAWSVPVITLVAAAPAAAASGQPPYVCIDPDGLDVRPITGQPDFKENNGQGFTLVKGDGVTVVNTSAQPIHVPMTLWTSASQEGVRVTSSTGDTIVAAPKSGNSATASITVPANGSSILRIVAPVSNAEAHLIIGCDRGFIFKSVGAA
jgi:hypothetical protein